MLIIIYVVFKQVTDIERIVCHHGSRDTMTGVDHSVLSEVHCWFVSDFIHSFDSMIFNSLNLPRFIVVIFDTFN